MVTLVTTLPDLCPNCGGHLVHRPDMQNNTAEVYRCSSWDCTTEYRVSQPLNTGLFQGVQDPFRYELEQLLIKYGKIEGSNTPAFQLAYYLIRCIEVFDETTRFRDAWHNPTNPPFQQPVNDTWTVPHMSDTVTITYTDAPNS